ncbi:acyltransferase domain-containing protein [Nocardia blacklockiae]|uniref:acyltransferase domain-containing protein n=1 Tax=Nocardia blacklockiae TaxID=480036 RepID=UPI00189532CE|nr:acyltransferase domain-containing protein [Nocardia blacklockiae]MBF6175870.1 acyltransferase domain-containing protein [Nocardia blacklockiae]
MSSGWLRGKSGGGIISGYRLPDGRIPVVLSAENPDLLVREAVAVRDYLDEHPEAGADEISAALLRTRTVRPHRALAMVSDREDLRRALCAVVSGEADPALVRGDGPATTQRTAFVFPGQGSQRPGMGKLYYDRSAAYRARVDECAVVLGEELDAPEPLHYLLVDDEQYIDDIGVLQPALYMHTLGLAEMWLAAGVTPAVTIGHSQGELAAAAVCGMATVRDTLVATKVRADLIAEHAPRGYTMAVLGVDIDECEALIARNIGWLKLSVVNSPNIVAISGQRPAVLEIIETVRGRGRFAKEIRVDYPAHTDLVAPYRRLAAEGVREHLYEWTFDESEIPLFAATIGGPVPPGLPQAEFWFLNLRNRVRFDRATMAAADSADLFVELADNPLLALAVQENLYTARTRAQADTDFRLVATSRRDAGDLGEFTRNLASVAVRDLRFRWELLTDGAMAKPGPATPPRFPRRALSEIRDAAVPDWIVPPADVAD